MKSIQTQLLPMIHARSLGFAPDVLSYAMHQVNGNTRTDLQVRWCHELWAVYRCSTTQQFWQYCRFLHSFTTRTAISCCHSNSINIKSKPVLPRAESG